MIKAASVFSTLGNPDSLVPLLIKDTTSTTGVTVSSYITGKEEGHDRLIDEVGTEAIWLGGIPFFKWLYNNTVFKALGLDSKFDARNFNDKDVFTKIQEYSPTKEVKNSIDKISKKEGMFKKLATARFIVSTGLAVGSYIGLTKFKQYYTDKKIRENLIAEYNANKDKNSNQESTKNSSNPSFKGLGSIVQNFAFSPVKNMWILDGCITGERLKNSRSNQEFVGYAIKESAILFFMYYAGGKIQELLEHQAEKKHKMSIGLDARVIEDGFLKKAFENGSIKKSIEEFNTANSSKANLYEFLNKNPENLIVKTAKMSDIIEMYKEPQGLFKKAKVTDKIDTRNYIDLKDVEGVKNKIEKLYKQYTDAITSGKTSEEFFSKVKKLKRTSILTNIGSCMFVLGACIPAIMLLNRMAGEDNKEFETKKRIRAQLIKEGVIK